MYQGPVTRTERLSWGPAVKSREIMGFGTLSLPLI